MSSTRSFALIFALCIAVLALGGCASTAPKVKVLGVSEAQPTQSRVLHVYVQVINPTKTALELSRLEYAIEADSWFSTNGQVRLERRVSADGATVLEIPVPYSKPGATDGKVQYHLTGRLFARDARDERSWKVHASGYIEPAPTGSAARIQFRVAAGPTQ